MISDHLLDEMTRGLAASLGYRYPGLMANVVREALARCWDDRIALVWSTADVQLVCPKLSQEEARVILNRINQEATADRGVTWDFIRDIIGEDASEVSDETPT